MAHLLGDIAQRKPNDAALVDERGESTWRQLDERVNRPISLVRSFGLEPGDAVALLCQNRREAVEVTMACLHTSVILVPVNWHWVADELAYVVADSGARAPFVAEQYLDVAVEAAARFEDCPHRVVISDADDASSGAATAGRLPDGFSAYEALVAAADPGEPADQVTGGPMSTRPERPASRRGSARC